VCALVLLAGLSLPRLLVAQDTSRFLPARDYLPLLLADPRQPTMAAKLLYAFDSPTAFGSIVEGDVALGASLPLYLLAGRTLEDGLVLGVEAGVFARFNLETREKDLITSDWIFAVPLVWHRGGHWIRLRYYHTSAHLGDEFMQLFEVDRVPYARDVAEALGWLQLTPSIGVYGGGGWAFRVDPPDDQRFTLRLGAQVESRLQHTVQPYAAADVLLDQDNDWRPRLNIQVGARIAFPGAGRFVRVAGELGTGPALQGQFNTKETTLVTLGFYVDL
jgi:hypothetical protein